MKTATLMKNSSEFPVLRRLINGKKLVYADNAATMQSPKCVVEAMNKYMTTQHANVHRGIYKLSEDLTEEYENARKVVADFIGAKPCEIVFTKNATESLNIVAMMLKDEVKFKNEVAVTYLEHHSNLVPWQELVKKTNGFLKLIEVNSDGSLANLNEVVNSKTKILATTHASNVLGNILPVKELAKIAHKNGAYYVVDAAQSVPHMKINVKDMDCDFLSFSGHKIGAPGIGVLYGKEELLKKLEPVMYGGNMVRCVDKEDSGWTDIPWKFEAGTPNVMGALGLVAAIKYFDAVGMKKIAAYENELAKLFIDKLKTIENAIVYGNTETGIVSFNLVGIHPHDVAEILDEEGIAIRAGNHCAQVLMKRFGIEGTCRVSFACYNTADEVDKIIAGLQKVNEVFK